VILRAYPGCLRLWVGIQFPIPKKKKRERNEFIEIVNENESLKINKLEIKLNKIAFQLNM
jgi:hypothetical protein